MESKKKIQHSRVECIRNLIVTMWGNHFVIEPDRKVCVILVENDCTSRVLQSWMENPEIRMQQPEHLRIQG